MDQNKLKAISIGVGGLSVILSGLLYVLITDLYLLNGASWLFIAIFLAFGGGFCTLFSESLKHKPVWFYVLKGLGIACSIAFLIVIFVYASKVDVTAIVKTKSVKTTYVNNMLLVIKIICTAFTGIAICGQGANIALNVIYKIDD